MLVGVETYSYGFAILFLVFDVCSFDVNIVLFHQCIAFAVLIFNQINDVMGLTVAAAWMFHPVRH